MLGHHFRLGIVSLVKVLIIAVFILLFIYHQIYHPGRNSVKEKPVQGTVLVHQHNAQNKYITQYNHSTNKYQTIKLTLIKIVNKKCV